MSVEVTNQNTFEKTIVRGDLHSMVKTINQADTRWVMFEELDGNPVALDCMTMTKMRNIPDDDAFLIG